MADILSGIDKFFDFYFRKYIKLIEKNKLHVDKLEDISYPDIDFIFLFKFVRIEIDHLKNIDSSILDVELRNIFEDGKHTAAALRNFKKSTISAHVIFKNNFAEFNQEAKNIDDKFKKSKIDKSLSTVKAEKMTKDLKTLKEEDRENIEKQKGINKTLADTLQNIQNARNNLEAIMLEKKEFEKKYLPIFLDRYKINVDNIIYGLIEQMAIFSFTADKHMWINALRSRKIMNFFHAIEATDNMNIQNYMKYHLDHQTSSDDKGASGIKFRKQLINSINKIKLFNAKMHKNNKK